MIREAARALSATTVTVRVPAAREARLRRHLVVVAVGSGLVAAVASAISIGAGVSDAYGDATHHLVIARRIVDSPTPGFAQLGTVWLPLPHLLLLPLVLISPLFWSGIAGAILGGVSVTAAAAAMFALVWQLSRRLLAAYVATVVLLANPNLLYLQSTAMTEPLFMAALLVTALLMLNWLQSHRVGYLLLTGLALGFAVSIRYDGWFALGAVALIVTAGTMTRSRDDEAAVANGIAVAAIPAFVIFMWCFYNWIIFGDPLEFFRSELAPATQAAQIGVESTEGNALRATYAYMTAVLVNSGAIWLSLGSVALAWSLLRYRRSQAPWVLLLLFSPAAFNIAALFLGQGVLRTEFTDPPGVLNIRYGIQAWPLIAISGGLVIGAINSRGGRRLAAGVVIAVVVAQLALYARSGPDGLMTLVDAQHDRPAIAETNEAASWFRDHVRPGETTLLFTVANSESARFFMRAHVPIRRFITENNDKIWKAALLAPTESADWMIVPPPAPGRRDALRDLIVEGRHISSEASFQRAATVNGWEFWRRVPSRAAAQLPASPDAGPLPRR